MSTLDDLLFGPTDLALAALGRLIDYKSRINEVDRVVSDYPIVYAPYIPLYRTCTADQCEFNFVHTINESNERQIEFYFNEDGTVSYL